MSLAKRLDGSRSRGGGTELGSPANDGVCVVVSVAGPYAGNEMGGVFFVNKVDLSPTE